MPEYFGAKHLQTTGASSGILYTDRRDFYLQPNVVAELYPDVTPFTTFIDSLGVVKAPDPDFKMFEHRSKWINMNGYVNTAIDWSADATNWAGAQSTGVTSVDVNTSTTAQESDRVNYLVDGDIIEIRAGSAGSRANGAGTTGTVEKDQVVAVCIVSAHDSSSTDDAVTLRPLDISSSSDGSLTYDIEDNDPFQVISHVDAEGSNSPEAWSDDLEVVWNSAGILKTSLEITGTLYEAALRGYSSELERLRMEKFREHAMKKNRAFLLGRRMNGTGVPTAHLTDSNSRAIRTTMGAIPIIEQYGTAGEQYFVRQWANYTLDDFLVDAEAMAQYDNAMLEKFAFCGSSVLTNFSKTGADSFFARSSGSVSLSDWKSTSMGFNIRTLTYPFGQLHIAWDPSMRYAPYKNSMVVVDPDSVKRVAYRQDRYQTAIQDNDEDLIKDQYFSDDGLGMTLVEKNALFKFN